MAGSFVRQDALFFPVYEKQRRALVFACTGQGVPSGQGSPEISAGTTTEAEVLLFMKILLKIILQSLR